MSFLVKQLMKSAVGHAASGRGESSTTTASHLGLLHPSSVPSGPSHAATVRTLMMRIETCEIIQEKREALRELSQVPDVGRFMTPDQVVALVLTGKHYVGDDWDITRVVVEILATATDSTVHGSNLSHRDALLDVMVDVPFFLSFLEESHFWSKYHCVQILQRIEDINPNVVHKQLLATQGVHTVIDVLNDGSNGGILRNEGLILLTSLTATDQELQTIVAFENGFESLFQIIHEEGDLQGGVVASDCLSAIVNILRGNTATQKFFREMGCAKHLVPVLNGVAPLPSQVATVTLEKGGIRPDWLLAFDTSLSADASVTLQRCISVLQTMLKSASLNQDDAAIRNALFHSGIVAPLAAVALSTDHRVDTAIQIEALRTLSQLLQKSRACCDALTQSMVSVRSGPSEAWTCVNAVWAILRRLFVEQNSTAQLSCAAIISAMLESSSSTVSFASFLMKNVSKPTSEVVPVPIIDSQKCGFLITAALFGALRGDSVSSFAPYYASVILQQVLMVPQLTEQMLFVPWEGSNVTFFTAFFKLVVKEIQLRKTDLCTISAFLRPLFTWLMYSAKAVTFFLHDDFAFNFFLDWSFQTRDTVHTRFLCLMMATAIVVAAPPSHAQKPASTSVDKAVLSQRWMERTAQGKKMHDLLADVISSPDWAEAPAAALTASPSVYDNALKNILEDVAKQADILVERAMLQSRQLSPETHSARSEPLTVSSPTLSAPPRGASPPPTMVAATLPAAPITMQRDPSPLAPPLVASTAVSSRAHHSEGEIEAAKNDAARARLEMAQLHAQVAALTQKLAEKEHQIDVLERAMDAEVSKLREENRTIETMYKEACLEKSRLELQHHETTLLLEEALQTKEEEARMLASSLSMLESRLHTSQAEASLAVELRSLLEVASVERDELLILIAELDEEREARRAVVDASGISPPRTVTDIDISPPRAAVHSDSEE